MSALLVAAMLVGPSLVGADTSPDEQIREVHTFQGELPAHVGTLPAGIFAERILAGEHTVEVPADAQRIHVRLTWDGAAGDLDPVLTAPEACHRTTGSILDEGFCHVLTDATSYPVSDIEPAPGWFHNPAGSAIEPDAPAEIELDAEDIQRWNECEDGSPCEWDVLAFADGPVARTTYTLTVELLRPAP